MAKGERSAKFRDRRKIKAGEVPIVDEAVLPRKKAPGGRTDPVATNHRKRRMIAALKDHLGVVAYACESVGIGTATHYRWLKEDPDYAEAVMESEDRMIGFTERKLLELVKEGDREACKFVLDRRGRRHGWGQQVQVSSPPGEAVQVNHGLDPAFLREEAPLPALANIIRDLIKLGGE